MNLNTGKQPPENEPESPREKIERAMASAIMEVIQLRRTLWLVVKEAGGAALVEETQAHPLWRMKATRLPDGWLKLEALQLPDPTDDQLATLAEILEGSKSQLGDAMQQTSVAPVRDYKGVPNNGNVPFGKRRINRGAKQVQSRKLHATDCRTIRAR